MKLHFSFSKLRKRPFFAKNITEKCKISKYRGARLPVPPPFRRPCTDPCYFSDPRACPSPLPKDAEAASGEKRASPSVTTDKHCTGAATSEVLFFNSCCFKRVRNSR